MQCTRDPRLPAQHSGGTFTVTADPDLPAGPSRCAQPSNHSTQPGVDQFTAMVHGAFQQSLESLRRSSRTRSPGMPA
jgi:hypothetical protein